MSDLIHVTDQDFPARVLQSPIPILVEFGAVWCVPCKSLEPVLKQIVAQYPGRLDLVKIDVEDSVEVTMKYNVMNLPTLILFKGGQEMERMVGAQPRDKIVAKIQGHLNI